MLCYSPNIATLAFTDKNAHESIKMSDLLDCHSALTMC